MSRESIALVYDGDAVRAGTMDVKELAPALLSIGELFQDASLVLNGAKALSFGSRKRELPPGRFRYRFRSRKLRSRTSQSPAFK